MRGVLCTDTRGRLRESDLSSLPTAAGIPSRHRNEQADPALRRAAQTLSSRPLESCCGRRVRTAPVPMLLGGAGGLGGRASKPSECRARCGVRAPPLPLALRAGGLPGPTHPLGAPAGSPAPQEQDWALMASTMRQKSWGMRTQRTELLSPWQRAS